MESSSILVVDDEINSLRSLITALEGRDFHVYKAGEKEKALEMYKTRDIDIVLVALDESAVNGFEILSLLKSYDSRAKVILYTDYGTKEHVVKALRMGASEFMEKPLRVETLLPVFRRLTEKESSGSAFQGDLRTMSLASIIQMNCEERIVGLLHLRRQGQEGRIFFDGGRVVHAEVGNLYGEDAVYHLLEWEQGTFSLDMGISPPQRTIEAGWSGLILEGMRRIDEGQAPADVDWQEASFKVEREKGEGTADNEVDLGERITKAILRIEGVHEVLICSQNGSILANERDGDVGKAGVIARYIIQQAEKLGRTLDDDQVMRVILKKRDGKEIVLRDQDDIIYLWVSKRAQADLLAHEVRATVLRYQS